MYTRPVFRKTLHVLGAKGRRGSDPVRSVRDTIWHPLSLTLLGSMSCAEEKGNREGGYTSMHPCRHTAIAVVGVKSRGSMLGLLFFFSPSLPLLPQVLEVYLVRGGTSVYARMYIHACCAHAHLRFLSLPPMSLFCVGATFDQPTAFHISQRTCAWGRNGVI